VLHGGSNNPDLEISIAARTGINKINISSDIKMGYHTRMREVMADDPNLREPLMIQPECIKAMNVVAAQKIDLFGAAGKAELYR
jgi:fructose-bisphosphate aldolase class II